MIPDPTALALILCEQVIVDQQSNNPSPINIFTGRVVESFPSEPQRFSVFAALADSKGNGHLELRAFGSIQVTSFIPSSMRLIYPTAQQI